MDHLLLQDVECCRPVGSSQHPVPLLVQQLLQARPHEFVVLYNQERRLHGAPPEVDPS